MASTARAKAGPLVSALYSRAAEMPTTFHLKDAAHGPFEDAAHGQAAPPAAGRFHDIVGRPGQHARPAPAGQHRYRAELREQSDALDRIRDLAGARVVTLVYSARDEEHNDAAVLRAVLLGRAA